MLEKLGPAVNAGKAVFLYGPPGNGKTVLAEGMGASIGGDMYIPHAIDVDGNIITMFDPICHVRARQRRRPPRRRAASSAPRRAIAGGSGSSGPSSWSAASSRSTCST